MWITFSRRFPVLSQFKYKKEQIDCEQHSPFSVVQYAGLSDG